MHKHMNIIAFFIFGILLFSLPVHAASVYRTRVRVIQAGKGPVHVDPAIKRVVDEMRPVFKYTNFKLLKEKNMALGRGEKGRMKLPGKRNLIIVPEGMKGNRIKYNIQINAKGSPVFRTGVMLKNKGSVTIGGPRVPKGVLLLDIQGSAR